MKSIEPGTLRSFSLLQALQVLCVLDQKCQCVTKQTTAPAYPPSKGISFLPRTVGKKNINHYDFFGKIF